MKEVVVIGMARTPFGAFPGSLASISAPRLGAIAIKAALERAKVKPEQVSEVIMGNVLQAGEGQAPARQASIYSGIPNSVPAMTVNKVCGSGMKAIMLGMQSILLGDSDIVVAGGMESMSQAPYLLLGARSKFKMGNLPLIDSMIHDGLWDPYSNTHMGNCGDLCASENGISRKEQDEYAAESFRRAQAAQKKRKFDNEITPVTVKSPKGNVMVKLDDGPFKVKFEKIPLLKPAFGKKGSVTAANASTIGDGAAAIVLTSLDKAKDLGIKALAKLISYGTHSQKPEWFSTATATAMSQAMKKVSWDVEDVDLFEVNEAFAVVAISAMQNLKIPHDKLNVFGGAIALGHPIGASGTRIVITLISALKDIVKKRGVAGICIGGGEATAVCLEKI